MRMRNVLVAALALAAFLTVVTAASADHRWSVYHWPSDNLDPAVVDRTTASGRDFKVPEAVLEWAGLGTPIAPRMASGGGDVEVVVKSINANWLGVARIWVDGQGHIQTGRVELNKLYLNSLTAAQWDHVLCQELGHLWGLDHNRDGATGGTPDDSCMNDLGHLGEYTSPNIHDAEELNAIYSHVDASAGGGGDGGGPGCGKNGQPKKCGAGFWVTVHAFRAR